MFPQSLRSRRIDQLNGLRSTSCTPGGADLSVSAHKTPMAATTAARIVVAERHVKDIATRAGKITVEVPSPAPPPTPTKRPLLNARSLGLNQREMAPDIET